MVQCISNTYEKKNDFSYFTDEINQITDLDKNLNIDDCNTMKHCGYSPHGSTTSLVVDV